MTLATFKIDETIWKQFQDKAKANNTNASALIKEFIDRYLGSSELTRDERLDRLEAGLEELRGKSRRLKAS